MIAIEKLAAIARTREDALERALPTIMTSSNTYERDVDNIQFALDRHIIGSVDDVRCRVEEFVEAGLTHFGLELLYSTMEQLLEQMGLFATEVAPKSR